MCRVGRVRTIAMEPTDGLVRGMQVTQGQDMPGLGEPQRDGLADPARRSCYDRDAPARLDHAACVTER